MMSPSPAEILFIEDNEADRQRIHDMLEDGVSTEWHLRTCETLLEGSRLLRSTDSGTRIAAVLLDGSLLNRGKLESLELVRQIASALPVVILIGNDNEDAADQALNCGAQDCLVKTSLTGTLLRKSFRYGIERKRLEQTWRRDLEQRVAERTAELSAANQILQKEILERRRAEEALQESRRFVERVTDATPSIVYILDVTSRKLVFANKQLRIVLGYELDDVRDWTDDFLKNMVHPDDLPRVLESLLDSAHIPDEETQVVEARARHANGQWRWLHCRMVIFRRNADGSVRLVLGAVEDVTDRRMAEEQSRQQQEQLVYVSRLTMLGELAAGLAHELNQPLMAITSYTQAALRRLKSAELKREDLAKCLEKASQQSLLAGEIIKRLRRMVSKRPPQKTETDLNETIRDTVELVRTEAERREVQVHLELPEELPHIRADRVQLQQVMLNLMRNGFEAMYDTPSEDRHLIVESRQLDQQSLAVSISDQGEGCEAQYLDQLFEPFFTTKQHGLGMGLPISRSIIESHGGQLTAYSNPNRGLTFQFTLPLTLGVAG